MQELNEIRKYLGEDIEAIKQYLGSETEHLLDFDNPKIKKESLHLPGPDFLDRVSV